MEKENEQKIDAPSSWREVTFHPEMLVDLLGLSGLVDMLNIINQRLCNLEDNVIAADPERENLRDTLTNIYIRSSQKMQKRIKDQNTTTTATTADPEEK